MPFTTLRSGQSSQSSLACFLCRRRKIRCGRELPGCLVCEQTDQQCEYPQRVAKPGPKIGSTQKSRKRLLSDDEDDGGGGSPWRGAARRRRKAINTAEPIEGDFSDSTARGAPSINSASTDKLRSGFAEQAKSIRSLSFIMHPSHESCAPESDRTPVLARRAQTDEESSLATACVGFGITPDVAMKLTDVFFDNFTSFQLFRRPHFRRKLQAITKQIELDLLLAAIFTFATKVSADAASCFHHGPVAFDSPPYVYYSELALQSVDEALREYDDCAPSLVVLQGLILITQWLLIQRVRGRAWRYLGLCITIAYELNLHLIDARSPPTAHSPVDPERWCEDEERRRAWWAIWEMDVFASVIRRSPTGIDWSQNKTFLPARDESWFTGEPQQSCFLKIAAVDRWKALEESGNQSAKAWFVVVNSFMKEAQMISNPDGLNPNSPGPSRGDNGSTDIAAEQSDPSRMRLAMILNSLRCFTMALPSNLKFRNQHLGFYLGGMNEINSGPSQRQQHSSIYSIHLMTQLTKMMIHHLPAFGSGSSVLSDKIVHHDGSGRNQDSQWQLDAPNMALEQYFEAADEILSVVSCSCEEHFRYVNPFLANTLWLAAATQLVHKECTATCSKELKQSQFQVLHMVHKAFVNFWNISTVLQQNLERLEQRLKCFRASSTTAGAGTKSCSSLRKSRPQVNRSSSNEMLKKPDAENRESSSRSVKDRSPIHDFNFDQTFRTNEAVGTEILKHGLNEQQGLGSESYLGLLSPTVSTLCPSSAQGSATTTLPSYQTGATKGLPGTSRNTSTAITPLTPFTTCSSSDNMPLNLDFMDVDIDNFSGATTELSGFLSQFLNESCLK